MRPTAPSLAAAVLLSACAPEVPEDVDPWDATVGAWAPIDAGAFAFGDNPTLSSVVFREDGTGTITYTLAPLTILSCLEFRWEVVGSSFLLDFEPNEVTLYLFNGLYGLEVDADSLTLVNEVGLTSTFEPLQALSPNLTCRDATVAEELPGLVEAYGDSNLALDESAGILRYGSSEEAAVLAVSTTGANVPDPYVSFIASNLREFQAYDPVAETYWFTENFSSPLLLCRTAADADCGTVDTAALGAEIDIETATVADGSLWLFGADPAGDRTFVEVDVDTLTLVDTWSFDVRLDKIAHDGDHVWGLLDDMAGPLIEIDPGTGGVLGTYRIPQLPPLIHRWHSVAAGAEGVWVMMEGGVFEADDDAVLRRLSLP